MKGIKALRQRLHDLKAEGRQKLEALNKLQALDDPSDSQQAEMQALEARIDELESDVATAQADLEKAERDLDRERAFHVPDNARIESQDTDPAETFGFNNLAEFALAVRAATPGGGGVMIDERLQRFAAPSNYHQESGGSSGEGYMVPPAMREQIWEVVTEDDSALMNAVDSEPTNSNSVEMLRDESTPWGSSGVQANWRVEGTQMSASKLATKSAQTRLHELYAFVIATEELLEDAPRLNDRLTRKAGLAIRWKASDAIMWGDGVGKPLGYMNSGAVVSVAKESGQAADSLVAMNIAKMFSRLLSDSIARGLWYANSDILPQLITMTLGDQPVWTPPATGITNAPGGFLLGRPLVFTEHCKTLGDQGDLQFVDPMGYYLATKRSGIRFDTSMHLYFDYAMQAFRWMFRFGGQPHLTAPVTPANGTSTKSHFIVLDERA